MTASTTPAPRPLCAAFAPLLPLISSGALEEDEATPTREHVAGCAWCQQEIARYAAVDEALRRQFGATHENILPFPFGLDGDEDVAEDYAFTLEDTLEETMAEGTNQQPPTTARSSRWGGRKRAPGPRATAIASIAAALILAVVSTTIYTQFAARHTTPSPVATTTVGGSFAKVITASNTTGGLSITSDGSLWFTEYADLHSKIGRFSPDGKLTELPVPYPDNAKHAGVGDMVVGPDGNLWFESTSSPNQDYSGFTSSIIRMTLDGAMTAFPLPVYVEANPLVVGPDKALWFGENETNKLERMTIDGHVTEFPVVYPLPLMKGDSITSLCIGPEGALWYTWFRSNQIGRMTLDGKSQNFAVPYHASAITSSSDGALWYVQSEPTTSDPGTTIRAGFIGHITTAGAASEVQITPSLQVTDVVKGPDGAMWFSAVDKTDSTLKLGRRSASGDVKVYSTDEFSSYSSIAAAPGAIWMLNGGDNTFWRYRLSA